MRAAREVLRDESGMRSRRSTSAATALEAQYREWLPVVEIDGERAFVYYVDPGALRRKVAAQSSG